MEQFSQVKNNRLNIIEEISKRIGIDKDADSFKRLSEVEIKNINERLKDLESQKIEDFKLKPEDLRKIKSGDLDFAKGLLNNIQHKVDSIQMLKIVDGVLTPYKNIKQLPKNITDDEKQHLFESFNGIKEILTKNNKRWGHSYHLQNTHFEMVKFIDEKTRELMANNLIVSTDVSYHNLILNEYISGASINPVFLNYSSCKDILPDSQGMVFDMVVLINKFFIQNFSYIKFISTNSYVKYTELSNLLVSKIISSAYSSVLFNKSVNVQKLFNDSEFKPEIGEYDSLLQFFSLSIDSKDLKYDIWSMKINSIMRMIDFISSTTPTFNIGLRKIIKQYCTVSKELLYKLDKVMSNPKLYEYINR